MHASLSSLHLWVLFRKLNSWIFNLKNENTISVCTQRAFNILRKNVKQNPSSGMELFYPAKRFVSSISWRTEETNSVFGDHYLRQEAERFTNTLISAKCWSPCDCRALVSCRLPSSDVTRFSPRLVFCLVLSPEGGAISLMSRGDKLGPGVSRSSPFSGSTVNCASYSICQNCPLIVRAFSFHCEDSLT